MGNVHDGPWPLFQERSSVIWFTYDFLKADIDMRGENLTKNNLGCEPGNCSSAPPSQDSSLRMATSLTAIARS